MNAEAAGPSRSSENRYQIAVCVSAIAAIMDQLVAGKVGEHLGPVLVNFLGRRCGAIFRENAACGPSGLFEGLRRISKNMIDGDTNKGVRRDTLSLCYCDQLSFFLRLKRQNNC